MRWILAIFAFVLALPAAHAASIEIKRLDAGNAVILVAGDLELGDIDQFRSKAANLSKATVAFQSDGGSLLAGIRIGSLIRSKGFVTVVPDRAQCASACAVAWLGGAQRFMGTGARVGFHAAYVIKAGTTSESGPGNAVLGAYLNQLGLREEAIIYITQAAPNSMRWLSMEEAGQHGIDVALLPPPDLAPPPLAALPSLQPSHADLERRATDFVLSLAARWSAPNTEALRALDALYAENVLYNGKTTRRQAVLSEKRRFAERWPQRSYKVRPGTISTVCIDDANLCRVHMMVDWDHQNTATAARARGAASFEYSIALAGEAPRIAAEASALKDGASAPVASTKPARQTLQRLLAQLTRLRLPAAPVRKDAIRPSAPIPHSRPAG